MMRSVLLKRNWQVYRVYNYSYHIASFTRKKDAAIARVNDRSVCMAEHEINVIDHLLDVEKDASVLVSDAQMESAKRLASARSQADSEYKKQYDILIASLENQYKKDAETITQKHADALNSYKTAVEKTSRDSAAFNGLLDSYLFTA